MKRWAALCCAVWLGLCAAGPARADDSAAEAEQRRQIQRERADVEQRFRQGEAQCAQRFVVTRCVDALKAQRREALAGLREREIVLDEAQRRREVEDARAVCSKNRPRCRPGRRPSRMRRQRRAPVQARRRRASGRSAAPRRPTTPPRRPRARWPSSGVRRKPRRAAMPPSSVRQNAPPRARRPRRCRYRRRCRRPAQRRADGGYTKGSMRSTASDRLSPPPRARWRALLISISLASRGGSACRIAPISLGVK